MTKIGIGFQLSASAAGMSQGINAGVVELQKLGLQAKKTSDDIRVLKTLEIGRVFLNSIRTVVTTFQQWTSGASSAIDQSNKLSRALGISYEELRQLQLAADLAGANAEQLANAFTRAQVTITKASRGGVEATRALRSLGLSVSELAGLSASQQFERIATAVATIENPAQRAAAAVAIFGRSGAQLLPVFQELSANLKRAETFFGGFQQRLSANDASNVEAVNDAFKEVAQAVQEVAGLLISKLSPALLRGASTVKTFIQGLNIDDVARRAASALEDFAAAAQVLARIVSVGLQRPLLLVGVAIAYINRQAIAAGVSQLASAFAAGASAARGLSASLSVLTVATNVAKVALQRLAAATVVGALVVAFGFAAEAAIKFATNTNDGLAEIEAAAKQADATIRKGGAAFVNFGDEAVKAGAKAKAALTLPQVSFVSLAQDAVGEAGSAVAGLAKELGSLNRVPAGIRDEFARIGFLINEANTNLVRQDELAVVITRRAQALTAQLRDQADARQRDTDAAKRAADEAQRIAEQNRTRVQELAQQGLSGSDASRLQLAKDLLAIQRERQAAEIQFFRAQASADAAGIQAAKDRLRLAQAAEASAREQDRERRLQSLGFDQNLIRPAQTLADEFKKVRDAFNQRLISPDEAKVALRNLAQEGLNIRREIDRELSRPSAEALRVSDIRSSEGIAAFFASGRRDPAIDQRAEQIRKLEEIRAGLVAIGVRPVDILGGA